MMDQSNVMQRTMGVAVTAVTALLFSFLSPCPAEAVTIIEREEISFDENLSDQQHNEYRPVETIAIARITAPNEVQFGDSDSWMTGLYYYSITKLGFADIPFNYVVTWRGKIYEGKGGGADVAPIIATGVEDELGKVVLIAYFDNNQDVSNSGKDAMRDLVSELLSWYDLDRAAVIPVDIQFAAREEEVQLSSLVLNQSGDAFWNAHVAQVRTTAPIMGVEDVTELSGTVEDVSSNLTVEAGQNFVVTATIENTGTVPWYNSGEHKVLVATSDPRDHDSELYYSDSWASFNRVVGSDEDWVLPGETGTFAFEVKTPLVPGEYGDSFELLMLPSRWISGTQFDFTFTVEQGDFQLVEVKDTETGYLNVRDCPSTGCAEVGKVVPGEVLILRGQEGNWYKIEMDDGEEGWVYAKYVKAL